MKNTIGIIQGRLSPSIDNKIQAFPWPHWQSEFQRASRVGLSSIEFIFEQDNYKNNPLITQEGQAEIKQLIEKTGVKIGHICADYFMERPFMRVGQSEFQNSIDMLKMLIEKAGSLDITGVEIPLVDNSRIENDQDKKAVVDALRQALPIAEKFNIEIDLETSLPPDPFKALLEEINHPLVKATYDTGNSASAGYDTTQEIKTLGKWISNVHIKDRELNGGTVKLGQGNAQLDETFQSFADIGYGGPFILQVARGIDGDEVNYISNNVAIVNELIEKYL